MIDRIHLKTIIIVIGIAFLVFIVMDQVAPYRQPIPGTDSSIFLYIGDQILDGKLPYLDAWDHKGPVVYYINALGLFFRRDSLWGVWMLQVLAVGGAAYFGYRLMRRIFGIMPALFGTALWLLALPSVIDGGNLTEEYALPFQFAALWLFVSSPSREDLLKDFLIGACAALAFWLRANIIGVPLAIGLYYIWQWSVGREKSAWKRLLGVTLGGFLVSGIIVFIFALQDNLAGLFEASFLFNFAYSDSSLVDKWQSVVTALGIVPTLSLFALAAWIIGFGKLRNYPRRDGDRWPILFVFLVLLPLEILLASISGRLYPHYYMTLLPAYALGSSLLLFFLTDLRDSRRKKGAKEAVSVLVSVAFLIAATVLPLIRLTPPVLASAGFVLQNAAFPPIENHSVRMERVLVYIRNNLGPDETLVMWGNNLTVNWLTGRANPSRYISQTYFFVPGFTTPEMIGKYIDDLYTNRPVIIDTTADSNLLPPLGVRLEKLPKVVRPLYNFVSSNFAMIGTIDGTSWSVYRFVGEQNLSSGSSQ